MLHISLAEYTASEASEDTKAIEEDVKAVKAKGWPLAKGASFEDLPMASKHYLAMKKVISEHNLDAIAVRCWPELPNDPGFESWCYMALARLATEGNSLSKMAPQLAVCGM